MMVRNSASVARCLSGLKPSICLMQFADENRVPLPIFGNAFPKCARHLNLN